MRMPDLLMLVDTTSLTGRIRELRVSETLALPVSDVFVPLLQPPVCLFADSD